MSLRLDVLRGDVEEIVSGDGVGSWLDVFRVVEES